MNYELAKQLKDAGFPQNGSKEIYCTKCKIPAIYSLCYTHKKEYIKLPTLSELIEACGESFDYLVKVKQTSPIRKGWYAEASKNGYNVKDGENLCDTPEEAVAKLYLILNQ